MYSWLKSIDTGTAGKQNSSNQPVLNKGSSLTSSKASGSEKKKKIVRKPN